MQFNLNTQNLFSMQHLYFRRFWFLLGVLFVLFVLAASLMSIPTVVTKAMLHDKVMHTLAYACLMGWFAQIFKHDLTRLMLVAVFITMGVGVEFLQALTPSRQFEVLDMIANSSGVVLAWALSYTWFGTILQRFEKLFYSKNALSGNAA